MHITKYLLPLLLSGFLLGCGSGDKEQGVIPEHQLKALDKAKGAEQMLMDAEEKRKKEMEKNGN
jgi:hypothetical protein